MKIFSYAFGIFAISAAQLVYSSAPVTAQAVGHQNNLESKRFGGWEFTCRDQDQKLSCRVSQRLVAAEASATVFLATILPAERKGQYIGILSVPSGGYLPPGMELRIDQGKPFRVLFETCNTLGCHGGFELSGRLLKELQAGKQLMVRLWTTKSQPVDVKVTLDGFAQAFEALRSRS